MSSSFYEHLRLTNDFPSLDAFAKGYYQGLLEMIFEKDGDVESIGELFVEVRRAVAERHQEINNELVANTQKWLAQRADRHQVVLEAPGTAIYIGDEDDDSGPTQE